MSYSKVFNCTAYWRQRVTAQKTGSLLTVQTATGTLVTKADPEQLASAKIEASALLDLSILGPEAGWIPLSWIDGKWVSFPWAPYGVGSKDNALQPWRDVASNSLPFGTRLKIPAPSDFPEMHGKMHYIADRFGIELPNNRLDLFFGRPAPRFRQNLNIEVELPNKQFSAKPTEGAQQALNEKGYLGKNGKRLKEDNIFGEQTSYALGMWYLDFILRHYVQIVKSGFVRPENPEIYFWVRAPKGL